MPKVTTSFSVDSDVKAQVQELYSELGLDMSTAINMFFKQCLYEKGLPFDVSLPSNSSRDSSAIEMTDDEKIDFVAQRILREHKAAFEELAK